LLMRDCRFALLQDGLATRVNHNFAHRESGNNSGIYPNTLAMAQIDLYVSRRSHSRIQYNRYCYHIVSYTFYRVYKLESEPIASNRKKNRVQVPGCTAFREMGFCPPLRDRLPLCLDPSLGLAREVAAVATFGGKSFL